MKSYWSPDMTEQQFKIPVGISQCLLGEKVRYDGGHKRSAYCTDSLASVFDFQPVCPEVGAGMGIPRPPIRLVEKESVIKVLGVSDPSFDQTDNLDAFANTALPNLDHLCGYILMQKSPSCGMERVPVYHENGNPLHHKGVGVFAQKLMEAYPILPIEESGRLNDNNLKENFIARVYAYHRWQSIKDNLQAKDLINFYSDYKYLVMAHNPQMYHTIGRVLSDIPKDKVNEKGEEFITLLMNTLKQSASRKKTTNVLMHIQGYFKKVLDKEEKKELTEVIEQYHQGDIPLVAPLILIKHFLKKHPNDYLMRQAFIRPYPDELRLRNAI